MTKTNPLTRKAGPLPVWAWAVLVLIAGYVYLNRAPAAQGGAQLPFTPAGSSSAAQQPASGQGGAADNGNSDLLDALGNNLASSDALLAALQAPGQGGGYGAAGGTGGASPGGTSTAATTAPTIDSGTNNAPVDTAAASPTTSTTPPASGTYYIIPGTDTTPTEYFQPTGWFQNEQGYARGDNTPDAIDRYLATHGAATSYATDSAPVTQPTPTVVQPAPVDTGGVIVPPTPRPTPGHNVAV